MEKQENSKILQKFNKSTVFLSKFIFGNNFEMLKKVGFIDSYTSDPKIMEILILNNNQRILYLLFKNKKLNITDIKKIVLELSVIPVEIVFSYELVNDYSMIVLDFPNEYIKDYDYFIKGLYSKFSQEFKDSFPMTEDVYNSKKIRIGKEYTLYYHIFTKSDWLKNVLMQRIGLMELDDKLELWDVPNEEDLTFNINKII